MLVSKEMNFNGNKIYIFLTDKDDNSNALAKRYKNKVKNNKSNKSYYYYRNQCTQTSITNKTQT